MFLRNLWELLRVNSQDAFYISQTTPYGTAASIKAIDGTAFTSLCNSHFANYTTGDGTYQRAARNFLNVFYEMSAQVGTGTTAPTADDYCLETDVTSSFTSAVSSVSFTTNAEGHFVITVTWSGTNATSSDIVLTEIGVVKVLGDKTNTSSTGASGMTMRTVMMARHVLATPVTVAAGQGTTITVQIELY